MGGRRLSSNQLSVSLHRGSCFVGLGPTRKERRCITFHVRSSVLLCCYTHSQRLISWTINVVVQVEIAEVCAFNQLDKKNAEKLVCCSQIILFLNSCLFYMRGSVPWLRESYIGVFLINSGVGERQGMSA